jgi:uncharacterized protein YjbI with pentapeptide repeats
MTVMPLTEAMQNKQNWYMRRGDEVRGPFPAGQISRYILLGRIRETDEISTDQINWQPVSDVPVLIPEEMKYEAEDNEAHERLMMARMREDERSTGDRRERAEAVDDEVKNRRSYKERRADEDEAIVRHREVRTKVYQATQPQKQSNAVRGLLAASFLVAVISAAWHFQPWQPVEEADCNAAPAPRVNWNNCQMEGVQLVAADLRGVRLRNATLIGADMRGAQLGAADLAYANLANGKLSTAMLEQADLIGANLRHTDLSQTALEHANLAYSILRESNLSGANLQGANLSHADMHGASIEGMNLEGARLDQAVWVDGRICGPNSVGRCD